MENVHFLNRNNVILGLVIIGLVFWFSSVPDTGPVGNHGAASNEGPLSTTVPRKSLKVPEISVSDAVAAIARGAVVIDVRQRDAYETAHIPNALSVPLDELKRRSAEFAAMTDKELVIYCGDGSTLGPEGTQVLTDAGHTATKNLAAGLPGWKAGGNPVASGKK